MFRVQSSPAARDRHQETIPSAEDRDTVAEETATMVITVTEENRRTRMKVELKDKERIDDLQRNGYQIIQNPEKFCFGMDAVLLTGFAHAREKDILLIWGQAPDHPASDGSKIPLFPSHRTGDPGGERRYGETQCGVERSAGPH